jgi:hypothetical protein
MHDALGPRKSGGLVGVSVLPHRGDQLFVETILSLGGRLRNKYQPIGVGIESLVDQLVCDVGPVELGALLR